MWHILAIDQSTASTKALIFDEKGMLAARHDVPHRQIIDENGWVEHDPLEIWNNLLEAVGAVIAKSGIDKSEIACVGISNQRETSLVWDRLNGAPLYNAIVWQCGRGEAICNRVADAGMSDIIKSRTGLNLSPYFSASKIAWVIENIPGCREKMQTGKLCCSTIDSWLLYKLTDGVAIKTDYSNASRTQLFNIDSLQWDADICRVFGIEVDSLPEVNDSDSYFGSTDFEGLLPKHIPVHGIIGDSQGALLAQGCFNSGKIKATYGTGSSVMMNTAAERTHSKNLVTSLAWGLRGKVSYVLEGNINYTGAVVKWLVDELGLFASPQEIEEYAKKGKHVDGMYMVPAFSGLGAPHWNSKARAMICGMERGCGKQEIAKAVEECIGYQITDVIRLIQQDAGSEITELRVDGGATKDSFLMQFQADIANATVIVSSIEELSGMGAACAAGLAMSIYDIDLINKRAPSNVFIPNMTDEIRDDLYRGWQNAVQKTFQ